VFDTKESYAESHAVFKKYQMTIHGEGAFECTTSDFDNFLIRTPLCSAPVCCISSLEVVIFVEM